MDKNNLVNGFTNYETFTFVLWLDNDKKMHDLALDAVRRLIIKILGYPMLFMKYSLF